MYIYTSVVSGCEQKLKSCCPAEIFWRKMTQDFFPVSSSLVTQVLCFIRDGTASHPFNPSLFLSLILQQNGLSSRLPHPVKLTTSWRFSSPNLNRSRRLSNRPLPHPSTPRWPQTQEPGRCPHRELRHLSPKSLLWKSLDSKPPAAPRPFLLHHRGKLFPPWHNKKCSTHYACALVLREWMTWLLHVGRVAMGTALITKMPRCIDI